MTASMYGRTCSKSMNSDREMLRRLLINTDRRSEVDYSTLDLFQRKDIRGIRTKASHL